VGVRLPIWAWRKQNRLADAARADSTGAAAALQDAELQLSREVAEAAAQVEALRQRLVLLVDGVLPSARGTVESVLRTYQVGRPGGLPRHHNRSGRGRRAQVRRAATGLRQRARQRLGGEVVRRLCRQTRERR